MIIRKARKEDLFDVLSLYQEERIFMIESGNPDQWSDFDELKSRVLYFFNRGELFVGEEDQKLCCVFALIDGEEKTYQVIEGKWIDHTPYATVHCIASRGRHKGREALLYALREKGHIRIDTHEKDAPMLHTLEVMRFHPCGTIYLENGERRCAFERSLSLSERLLNWYDEHQRNFPWRKCEDPYRIWISEIMLQQTRADTVIPYYLNFLERYPDVFALADAKEDDYLKLWQGLGYYSRARNLHKAAEVIVSDYKGQMPSEKKELMKLPGIGAYTSSAILAFAFDQKEVAVDGNLLRVFARLTYRDIDLSSPKTIEECRGYLLDKMEEKPSDFNQALMDLGELICLPNGAPKCDLCPLSALCLAHRKGAETDYPKPKKKMEKKKIFKSVFYIEYQDRVLIRKRENRGLLASMYEPMNIDETLDISKIQLYLENKGFKIENIRELPKTKHVFTHLIWEMTNYKITLSETHPHEDFIYVSKKEVNRSYSIPSAFVYLLK